MAINPIEILISARDDASAKLQLVSNEVRALESSVEQFEVAPAIFLGLATAIAAVGTAAVILGAQLSNDVEQLGRLSDRTGVSVQNLQVMRESIRESGGNAEALTTSLSFLNRAIAEQNDLLAKLGITTHDPLQAMLQLGQAFAASSDSAAKNAIAFKLLGRGGAELISDVQTLATSFDRMKDAATAAGLVLGTDAVEQAKKLDAEMDRLSLAWEGAMTRLKVATLPAATAIVGFFDNALERGPQLGIVIPILERYAGTLERISGALRIIQGLPPAIGRAGAGTLDDFPREPAGAPTASRSVPDITAALGGASSHGLAGALDQASREALVLFSSLNQLDDALQAKIKAPGFAAAPGEQLPEPKPRASEMDQVLQHWKETADQVLTSAGQLNVGLEAVWTGLETGFSRAFANIKLDATILSSFITTVFQSLVQSVLQALARLAAASIFRSILKLLGVAIGGPGALAAELTAADKAAVPILGNAGGGILSSFGASSTATAPVVTQRTTINIQALDAQSFTQYWRGNTSPYRNLERRRVAAAALG